MTTSGRPPDHDHLRWLRGLELAPAPARSLLDLGCGSGAVCAAFAAAGASPVVGVDLLPPDVAPQGWEHRTVNLDEPLWPEPLAAATGGTGFMLITAFDLLEHLASPVRFLEQVRGLLAPGGSLVVTTPNTSSWERLLRPRSWSGATDPQHRVLFCRYSLGFLLERSGYRLRSLRAPVRRLGGLAVYAPQVGAQIIACAGRD